jgi:hypothetical protein
VKSTNVASIGFDKEASTLEVEFKTGGIYQYLSVPEQTFSAFMLASSKGRFFEQKIRNIFRTKRIR